MQVLKPTSSIFPVGVGGRKTHSFCRDWGIATCWCAAGLLEFYFVDKDVCLVRPDGRGVLNDGFDMMQCSYWEQVIKMLRDCQSRPKRRATGSSDTLKKIDEGVYTSILLELRIEAIDARRSAI